MSQNITIKIAGTDYPLVANSPEMEQLMRLSAEEIGRMLAKYDEKFPDKSLVDKLAFVALNQTVGKIAAQRKVIAVGEEVEALQAETQAYLEGHSK